jgi:outer membrane protein TolC
MRLGYWRSRFMRSVRFAIVVLLAVLPIAALAGSDDSKARVEQVQDSLRSVEQRQDQGAPLTLQAAIDEALNTNPTLITLRKQFEASRHRPAQEQSLMAPSFEAQIWQWPINTIDPLKVNMYMFTVHQDLPGPGKRQLRAELAEKDSQVAESQIAVSAREIIGDVKRTYVEIFLARKETELRLRNVELLRQFADASEAKYSTGKISQQDVLKAFVELSRMHDEIFMLDERVQVGEAQLNALLGRPVDAPIGPLAEPHERVSLPPVSELQQTALDRHPELQMAKLERQRSDAALAVAKQEYRPDFFVGGGYMLSPQERDSWTASIGITWPRAPWARKGIDARVAEAAADTETALAKQHEVENSIRLAVQQAYVRVAVANQRAELLRSSILPQSEQTLEVSRVAYQTDRGDFLALIDNQRVLLDTQLSYYRALGDSEQALADLERAVGSEIAPLIKSGGLISKDNSSKVTEAGGTSQ